MIPPGARVPGVEDETDTPFNGGLRARLNQHEVATMLCLRAEYDKSLREGQVDETGCVNLSIEALALALKNLLSRSLPESLQERKSLFKRLRQLRVIRFAVDADLAGVDSWIKIRPMIVHMVGSELIESLRDSEVGDVPADDASEDLTVEELSSGDLSADVLSDEKSSDETLTGEALTITSDAKSLFSSTEEEV